MSKFKEKYNKIKDSDVVLSNKREIVAYAYSLSNLTKVLEELDYQNEVVLTKEEYGEGIDELAELVTKILSDMKIEFKKEDEDEKIKITILF